MAGFEGIGDFDSDDPYQRYIAHQAAKGHTPATPKLPDPEPGRRYRAGDLPAGSVVSTSTGAEYVRCRNIPSLMRWEQPIPGSEDWTVTYIKRLPEGEWMTEREKREVKEAVIAGADPSLTGRGAHAATHDLQDDPPAIMTSMRRRTCTRCGRAEMRRPNGTTYGSATEVDCQPTSE